MSIQAPVKIRYNFVRTAKAHQTLFPGAQSDIGKRGWWPQVGVPAGGSLSEITQTLVFGGYVFAVGSFDTIGGVTSKFLAAILMETGAADPTWAHTWGSTGTVQGLGTDGTFLYVGGDFDEVDGATQVDGKDIDGLVRFDYQGRLDTTWNPEPNVNPDIDRIIFNRTNGTMYIAGNGLTSMGGLTRTRIAEVKISDASTTAFAPDPDNDVFSLALDTPNQLIYVGGAFTNIGGQALNNLARVDNTGSADAAWAPDPNSSVRDVVLSGENIYAVGDFTTIGVTSVARGRGALIDQKAEALPWDPDANGPILKLARFREMVFLGGEFTTLKGGTARSRAGAVSQDGVGVLDGWDPSPNTKVSWLSVNAKTVFTSGTFTSSGFLSQGFLQAIPWPILTDANTRFVSALVAGPGTGTFADPYKDLQVGLDDIDSAHTFVSIKDSESYSIRIDHSYSESTAGGLYAEDGETPTIRISRGAVAGTYGARVSGRTTFAAIGANTYFVSKQGDDGTGVRGNVSKSFLTIQGALDDGSRLAGDVVQVEDNGIYAEDLDIGALAVTIQARDGKVPTLRTQGAADHIDVTGAPLTMFGMNVIVKHTDSGTTIQAEEDVILEDCSFSGGNHVVRIGSASSGNVAITMKSCFFQEISGRILQPNHKNVNLTYQNCLAQQCHPSLAPFLGLLSYFRNDAGASLDWIVEDSTFEDCRATAVLIRTTGFGTSNGQLRVKRCVVTNRENYAERYGGIVVSIQANSSFSWSVEDSLFVGLSGNAVHSRAGNLKGGEGRIESCVARRCNQTWIDRLEQIRVLLSRGPAGGDLIGAFLTATLGNQIDADFHCGPNFDLRSNSLTAFPNQAVVKNCASLNSGQRGFYFRLSTAAGTLTVENCVSMRSGKVGFLFSNPRNKAPKVRNLAEDQSGLKLTNRRGIDYKPAGGSSTGLITFQNCLAGTGFRLRGSSLSSSAYKRPLFLSLEEDLENAALSATSDGINSGFSGENIGLHRPLVKLATASAPFDFDGLTFSGPANSDNGLEFSKDLDAISRAVQCTFSGLGPEALRLASAAGAEASLFSAVNGLGINTTDASEKIQNCVVTSAGSAGFWIGGPVASVNQNTVFGSQYGQFDGSLASHLSLEGNVYAGSSVLDYEGLGTQSRSVIPTLSEGASVQDGSRLDPLFRDESLPDLRIQTTETGFPFDSPAKDLVLGEDAGAFTFTYGPTIESFTLVDLGTPGYRNPDEIVRRRVPVKLFEGETYAGGFYSDAPTFRFERVLSWGGNNDMPNAQVTDLGLIYITGNGEVQISFDGGTTFLSGQIVRSNSFEFTEISGLGYTTDDVNTPVNQLIIRETS